MRIIKNRNTKGRPKKSATEKRRYMITVKLATAEYYELKAKSKPTGMTVSHFVRQTVSCSEVKQRLTPEHLNLIVQLTGMANNLNQIAKQGNAYGFSFIQREH